MTLEQIIGLLLVLLIMLIGLVGSVLPAIPGTPLVLGAAIAHRLWFGEQSVGDLTLGVMVVLTLLAFLLDYVAGVLGAKKLGATWRGLVGAILGALVGMFFLPFGILVGPFLGAMLAELLGGRKFEEATRAGGGAAIGVILGTAGKVACCVAMMAIFFVNVAWNSWPP